MTDTPTLPFRYRLEAFFVNGLWRLFAALPVDTASNIGAALITRIGPMLKQHRLARRNLEKAFPEKTPEQIGAILHDMWDNLGRSAAEMPSMDRILDPASGRVTVTGQEHLDMLRDDGLPGIMVSGHLANWEISPLAVARQGVPLHLFFRAPNNPLIAPLYDKIRALAKGELLPKGRDGARRALKLLKDGGHLGMLVDQKMNDGIPVPFFGRPAMTAPAAAALALRFKCPIVPTQVVRTGPGRFAVTVHAPLKPDDLLGSHDSQLEIMTRINTLLEDWIRQNPAQWLWVHRRWPD
ncbi:LpxL/LpxP family acyltransferase [Novispirillum itersonii]|uniref:KDO2-lipid IV(A) lauroyltransferase n=1 Tax=Novispirillum itersonii TaxID=189 RepID=A0A7W9ZEL5_NOVIT|nr:lauroyl acyltransferase [Novispirillum itersonii]MBB6209698.1 KDO2-lipid IV(A) lauroyltransferase [Novispirillum itersonii]